MLIPGKKREKGCFTGRAAVGVRRRRR